MVFFCYRRGERGITKESEKRMREGMKTEKHSKTKNLSICLFSFLPYRSSYLRLFTHAVTEISSTEPPISAEVRKPAEGPEI